MKLSHSFFALLCLLNVAQLNAQVIPDSLRVDWSQAGFEGSIPKPSTIINVKDFGAFGDGVHDDYTAIINAMNASTSMRVVYFPAGNYLIKSPVNPSSNVVLRGEGTQSNLVFDLSAATRKNAFNIASAQNKSFTTIDSGYNKASSVLYLSNAIAFTPGSYAEIREANGAWNTVPASWANYCVGQLVKIKSVNENKVTIEPALRIDYSASLNPSIRPITVKTNVGIECLKITRADTIINNNYGYNIDFSYAVNCWVTGVESAKSQASHIMLESSKNITISGCYFHDAFTYDGTSTAGYGVTMIQHNSDSKVENCIFQHLRHSLVAKQGANGNVFAYNYSTDAYRSEEPHDAGGDMVLHGHYAFANLFEGNIGQTIIVDDTWGPAGPYNTFFRNRATLYGIIIFDQTAPTVKQNIVGNEVINTDSLKGNYYLQPALHFTYDNNINNIIQPLGTGNLTDSSYYLKAKPYFWSVHSSWPSIGGFNALNSGTIPAKESYTSGNSKTVCLQKPSSNLFVTAIVDSIKCNGDSAKITINATGGATPYNGTGVYYKAAGSYVFSVTDAFDYTDSIQINITQPLPVIASIDTTAAKGCANNGSITIRSVAGGAKPYLFSLNTGSFITDSTFKNLAPGNYTVRIKDTNNCIKQFDPVIVAHIPAFTLSATTTKSSLCRNDGSITIKRTGGKTPFQYSINGKDYVSANIFSNLAAGNYTCWAKDKTGCVDSLKNVIVANTAALTVSIKKTNVSCKGGSDGKIIVKASGGKSPYLYSLDSINYTSTNTFSNLTAGTYKVWVKDAAGCIAFAFTIIQNGKTNCVTEIPNDTGNNHALTFSVFPNPSTQKFILSIKGNSEENISFCVVDMYGKIVYAINGNAGNSFMFGENFAAGIYTLKIMQHENIYVCKIIKQ